MRSTIYDQPASPREPAIDHCSNGCDKDDHETYACSQKACPKDHLCEGCIWVCADCSDDFCESHTAEIPDATDARFSVYLCAACLLKRHETPKKPAAIDEAEYLLAITRAVLGIKEVA